MILRALQKWQASTQLPQDDYQILHRRLSRPYTLYGSMLLLPFDSIRHGEALAALSRAGDDQEQLLLHAIAKEMKVTRIAINQPIPLACAAESGVDGVENTMRAPLNFLPIYGDFGPSTCSTPPSRDDYDHAYWTEAKQNGILQVWAPRWTMFSRGNITEKARLLTLPTIAQAVAEGDEKGTSCAAVDLYAGIGYFTFSYLKAGVQKVLCWELNGWSCEGLRRGAIANRWTSSTFDDASDLSVMANNSNRVLIFNESNEMAPARLAQCRKSLPPIRHVNCGLLPSSRGSWPIAVRILDPVQGGWIHVHENFALSEIQKRAEDVCEDFRGLLVEIGSTASVVLESVNRVKTYAPGVWHCVLDLRLVPD